MLAMPMTVLYNYMFNGGSSSVGRVPDCDSGCRGFEPHLPPQKILNGRPRVTIFLLKINELTYFRQNTVTHLTIQTHEKWEQFWEHPADVRKKLFLKINLRLI